MSESGVITIALRFAREYCATHLAAISTMVSAQKSSNESKAVCMRVSFVFLSSRQFTTPDDEADRMHHHIKQSSFALTSTFPWFSPLKLSSDEFPIGQWLPRGLE
jgi:hypothetical protein